MSVRTRFAPSPTGYLHIGGVRTALFNWLFAKGQGGQFILRIDDTDAQRNVEQALAPILHGLRWLGLDWDEGPDVGGPHAPYYQSQRLEKYQGAVAQLLAAGAAYRDYARPEELQAERDEAQKAGRPFLYGRRWRAETDADARRFETEGRQGVVRLLMPREGQFVLNDLVRGEVRVDWASEQDHVIQRADGTCLYHLATVVDDHDMEISHVIRAEEHLSNTPRQVFMFEKLGFELPQFAHLPYVAEPGSKTKLSKRKLDKYLKNREFAQLMQHGQSIAKRLGVEASAETFNPVIVDFYEQVGYVSDGLLNYLLLLGWSLDDKTEDFTREEMLRHFTLERVNKSPASFDPEKLLAFEGRAMQRLPIKQRVAKVVAFLQRAKLLSEPPLCDTAPYLTRILEAAGDRLKVAGDILDYDDFFTADDRLQYDQQALEKRLIKPAEAGDLLRKFRAELATVEPFTAERLEQLLQAFVAAHGIKPGDIVHAVRVAVTGKAVGFGLFETLAILGRERSLARMDRALQLASAHGS
ncbi:MAG TPA: glutamate--tRNA ligase [Lacipirellulaceae bacterium]|jgi:glutamyl-tRNA synthetase|nr:glutamate--tRNA ligase [Lacipirellulaceae bacterium]